MKLNAIVIRIVAAMCDNIFFRLLLILVAADLLFGSLRAAKYHKWNSAVGIDGCIRKVGMICCIVILTMVDIILSANVLTWLPVEAQNTLAQFGVVKLGIMEMFALLFILYEATSVLKNMLLCGIPIPAGLQTRLAKFLDTMTDESQMDILSEVGPKQALDGEMGNKQMETLIIDKSRELAKAMGIDVPENATAEELAQLIAAEAAKL